MLQSLKHWYGARLGASDGEIGRVKDFYFEDQTWAIRYVVADTGAWLPERQVLISPHALGSLDETAKVLRVNLTRQQIENSPPVAAHRPVSRQYEEEYARYYGWPCYWQDEGVLGRSGIPSLELPPQPIPGEQAVPRGSQPDQPNAHLRSAQAVNGYHIQASNGTIGHICDFMMDGETWAIRQLVVKTGHRFSGKEVQLATRTVDWLNHQESKVFVNLTKEAVEQSPEHHLVLADVAD